MEVEVIGNIINYSILDKPFFALLILTVIFGIMFIWSIEKRIKWKKKYMELKNEIN